MQGNIIKSISNVQLSSGDSYVYTLHFTEDKILWECIEIVRGATFILAPSLIRKRMNEDKIPPKERDETFELEYWQIEGVEIKKGKFEIALMRDYPILKKKHTVHFDKKDQSDVESIFRRMLPSKTIIKSAGEGI